MIRSILGRLRRGRIRLQEQPYEERFENVRDIEFYPLDYLLRLSDGRQTHEIENCLRVRWSSLHETLPLVDYVAEISPADEIPKITMEFDPPVKVVVRGYAGREARIVVE